MNKIPFGKTGFEVSRLGFGAGPIGYLKTDQDQAGRLLNLMLDSGVNFIDTAASYEGSEEVIGHAIAHRRGEYVLVSKCGRPVPQAQGDSWSKDLIGRTIDAALKRLRTDVIDVMLLHSCNLATLEKGEAIGALDEARAAGKIRFSGYSGDNDAAAWAAGQCGFAVVETSVNIVDQHNIDTVLPTAHRNNVGVIAKRPIANSCWRPNLPGIYGEYARPYRERFEQLGLDPLSLGFKGPEDWPEIALRFTLSQPGVHTAIIGTTSATNARANIAAAEKGPLPAEVVEKIRGVFNAAAAGKWEGLT